MSKPSAKKRLLLLFTTTGYQARWFRETAAAMGIELVLGSDRCHVLDDPWRDGALSLPFEDPDDAAQSIVRFAHDKPIHGVAALGDRATATAARAAGLLGLPYHPPQAADTCRDKHRSRARLRHAGLAVPPFRRFPLVANPRQILAEGGITFPCVLKPLSLSASRGVIRADNPEEFVDAFERIRALLRRAELEVLREPANAFLQVENYVEGSEVAAEALMVRGRLKVLAIFDKPDPLTGPFFEETLYITPSRLEVQTLAAIGKTLEAAVRALGLHHGPLHAEFRVQGDCVFVLEVAARSIGGLCSRALHFEGAQGETMSLEELIIRLALGEDVSRVRRERQASGVMMIPIPAAGIFEGVEGVERARAEPGVEDLLISVKPTQRLEPLPEGCTYLGFIFARGSAPGEVEASLRAAHAKLRFRIIPALPVVAAT